MTYFGFLLRFLVLPLVALLLIALWDERRGKAAPGFQGSRATWLVIGLHVLLAVVYTTPWDNYLVATGVWYYNPALISGLLLGWVPIEEYTFFVLETIFAGLWWWFLARRLPSPHPEPKESRPGNRAAAPGGSSPGGAAPRAAQSPTPWTAAARPPAPGLHPARILAPAGLGGLWLASVLVLAAGWQPGTYLALILAWAIPPIALQLAFGADILWRRRRLVLAAILPIFLYLSLTDSLAIAAGTWTIDPAQSTGLFIGALPVEELIFFLVTVVLICFGLTLALAKESQARLVLRWVRFGGASRIHE